MSLTPKHGGFGPKSFKIDLTAVWFYYPLSLPVSEAPPHFRSVAFRQAHLKITSLLRLSVESPLHVHSVAGRQAYLKTTSSLRLPPTTLLVLLS